MKINTETSEIIEMYYLTTPYWSRKSISVTRDGKALLIGFHEDAFIHDIVLNKPIDLQKNGVGEIVGIVEGVDGEVIVCDASVIVKIYDRSDGTFKRFFNHGHINHITGVSFDNTTQRIFTRSYGELFCWDNKTLDKLKTILPKTRKEVGSTIYENELLIPKTTWFVCLCAYQKKLRIWDKESLQLLVEIDLNHLGFKHVDGSDSYFKTCAVTPDDQNIVIAGDKGEMAVYSIPKRSFTMIDVIEGQRIPQISVSRDGSRLYYLHDIHTIYMKIISPPYPYQVFTASLLSTDIRPRVLHVYSDGSIRYSCGLDFVVVAQIDSATECNTKGAGSDEIVLTGVGGGDDRNNAENSMVLKADSPLKASEWVDWINAVRNNLRLDSGSRSRTPEAIMTRYKYDMLQTFMIKTGPFNLRVPRSIRKQIGKYAKLDPVEFKDWDPDQEEEDEDE